jgi:hypothetical protein
MPACDQATSDANRDQAHQINVIRANAGKPTIAYAKVAVAIVSIAPGAQSFDATGENITPGDIVFTTAGEDNRRHRFRLPKNQVWLECPSTATAQGAAGVLYISLAGLGVLSEDAPKVRIAGATPESNGLPLLFYKWPDPGPDGTTRPLKIWPTSIMVFGYAFDDPEFHFGVVDLLDGSHAGFEQTIDLDRGAEIQLNLTEIGFGRFQAGGIYGPAVENALRLIQTAFHDDVEARAAAWKLVALTRKYLDTHQPRDDREKALHGKLGNEIGIALDSMKAPPVMQFAGGPAQAAAADR